MSLSLRVWYRYVQYVQCFKTSQWVWTSPLRLAGGSECGVAELGSRLSVPPSAGGLDPEQGTSGLRHQCGRARHQGHWHPHIILVIHSLFTESTECSFLRHSEFLKNHQIRNKGWSIWSFMSLRSWIFQLAQLTNTALVWHNFLRQ